MAKYLFEVNYTLDGIKGVKAKGATARLAAAREAVSSAGGSIDAYYFAFGGTDVYAIVDLPDNVAAASLSLTMSAAGGLTARTVVLLTPEEIDQAVSRSVTYSPPAS